MVGLPRLARLGTGGVVDENQFIQARFFRAHVPVLRASSFWIARWALGLPLRGSIGDSSNVVLEHNLWQPLVQRYQLVE